MATVAWDHGRKKTLRIANGQTTSDVLDLGRMPQDVVTRTQEMIRGATPGGTDLILLNGQEAVTVNSIVSVVQGATTFVVTTDYTKNGNSIDWGAAGAEPAAGSKYTVTYTYTKAVGPKSYRRWDITVLTPATVTGTVNPQVAAEEAGPFCNLQSGGADITLPTGSKAVALVPLVARYLRLNGTSQGQDSDFTLMGVTITNER